MRFGALLSSRIMPMRHEAGSVATSKSSLHRQQNGLSISIPLRRHSFHKALCADAYGIGFTLLVQGAGYRLGDVLAADRAGTLHRGD
jgi:hypothetical protein